MITSMTGYSRTTHATDDGGCILCECRTVNHRYLDISVNLPSQLRPIELELKQKVSKILKRGKVDINLQYQPGAGQDNIYKVEPQAAKNIAQLFAQLQTIMPDLRADFSNVLKMPGVLNNTVDLVAQTPLVFSAISECLEKVVEARQAEGAKLLEFFNDRLREIQLQLDKIATLSGPRILRMQDNMRSRIQELQLDEDQSRIEQEIVFIAQKLDISEELQRLSSHLTQVKNFIHHGGVVGRRLDFFMQELNREINTIGSKSQDEGISMAVIELKVLVEQMREQVQNIE